MRLCTGHPLRRSGNPKSMGGIPHAGVVTIAICRPHVACIAFPGSRSYDALAAVPVNPGGSVDRCALIILMPAVLDPLIDPASHIIEAEWICFETADL